MKHVKYYITDIIRQRNTKAGNPVFIVKYKVYTDFGCYIRTRRYTARTKPNAIFAYRLIPFDNGRKCVYRIDSHETKTGRIIIDNIIF